MHFTCRVCQFAVPRLEKEQISFPWGSIWATPGENYVCGCSANMERVNPSCFYKYVVFNCYFLRHRWELQCHLCMEKVTFNNNIAHEKKGKLQLFAHCRYAQLSVILCPAGGGVLAPKKLWHLVRCVCVCVWLGVCVCVRACVCNPLTPPQGVETTSSGGSQGYFQPADISDSLW